MPVKMTVETHSLVTVFRHGLPFDLRKLLPLRTQSNAVDTLSTFLLWFWADFQGFESGPAREANEAVRMEMLMSSAELHHTSFNRQLTLMAGSSCPFAGW